MRASSASESMSAASAFSKTPSAWWLKAFLGSYFGLRRAEVRERKRDANLNSWRGHQSPPEY